MNPRNPQEWGEIIEMEAAKMEGLRLQKELAQAQAVDLQRQLQEAWDALAFWSGIPYNDAILEYLEQKKMLEIDERNENE